MRDLPAPTPEPYAYDPRRVLIRDAYGQPALGPLTREQARALWERLGRWLDAQEGE